MADIETKTVNQEGYHALSRAGNFELSIDQTGQEGPTTNEVLIANYASCFTFACRAAAQRRLDVDLGVVETEAEADLDDSDNLEAIRFEMYVEADLDAEQIEELIEIGQDICHVQAAIREGLTADIDVTAGAF